MPNPKKRDNAYWLARLEREHPAIHARLLAGDIPSVRAACAEAGLIHLPTRLDALKREWAGASAAERETFFDWLKGASSLAPPLSPSVSLIGGDGRLLPETIARIEAIMTQRGLLGPGKSRTGPIMTAMGYRALDGRLGRALSGRWKPSEEFGGRLQTWLAEVDGD